MNTMIERHALSGDIIVSKLLIDCPKGMELYCPIFGCNMYLECVTDDGTIKVRKRYPNSPFIELFDNLGSYETGGECMIFPSKENRDWTKFNK